MEKRFERLSWLLVKMGVAPSEGAARMWYYRHQNAEGILRVGRRVLVDPERFCKWLETHFAVTPVKPLDPRGRRA